MTLTAEKNGNLTISREDWKRAGIEIEGGDEWELIPESNMRLVIEKSPKPRGNFAEWLFSCPVRTDDFPLPDRSEMIDPDEPSIFDDE